MGYYVRWLCAFRPQYFCFVWGYVNIDLYYLAIYNDIMFILNKICITHREYMMYLHIMRRNANIDEA